MIEKQKINLKKFCKEAEAAGCRVTRSNRSRCYASDTTGIVIATTTGAVRIPIGQIRGFLRELDLAINAACEMWSALNLVEKNQLSHEQGTSYGKMEQVFYELRLGGNHEQKNR